MSWSGEGVDDGNGCREETFMSYAAEGPESAYPVTPYSRRDVGVSESLAQHPSGCVPHVHNMTATCSLGCQLDLARIACSTRNTEYNPNGLPGAIMRLVDPKSVALIFDSGQLQTGKMVVMGTPTAASLKLAARRCAKIVTKIGFPVHFHSFKVVNMLATCDTQFPIRIEGIYFKHAFCSYYEPEVFPGLVYRMRQPRVTMMVFVSGKVVLVGAREYGELVTAYERLYPSLLEFRKTAGQDVLEEAQDVCALDSGSLQRILLQNDPGDPAPS